MQLIILTILFCLHNTIGHNISSILPNNKFICPYSPYWDSHRQSVFFVDYFGNDFNIIRYDYVENRYYKALLDGYKLLTFIIPIENSADHYAIGSNDSVIIVQWNGISSKVKFIRKASTIESNGYTALNIGKADRNGVLYVGTYNRNMCRNATVTNGSLFRFKSKYNIEQLLSNINLAGGLDWNIEKKKFYFADPCKCRLIEYDWNPRFGTLSKSRVVYDFHNEFKGNNYGPLGVTIDTAGMVYVTVYRKGAIFQINPKTSRLMNRFDFPASFISGITFGGPDLKTMFVTSEYSGFNLENGSIEHDTSSLAGALFTINNLSVGGYRDRPVSL